MGARHLEIVPAWDLTGPGGHNWVFVAEYGHNFGLGAQRALKVCGKWATAFGDVAIGVKEPPRAVARVPDGAGGRGIGDAAASEVLHAGDGADRRAEEDEVRRVASDAGRNRTGEDAAAAVAD